MVWPSSLNTEMKIFSWLHIRITWFLELPPTYPPYSLHELCPFCVSKWKALGKYLTPFASCQSSISSWSRGYKSQHHLQCFLEEHFKKNQIVTSSLSVVSPWRKWPAFLSLACLSGVRTVFPASIVLFLLR